MTKLEFQIPKQPWVSKDDFVDNGYSFTVTAVEKVQKSWKDKQGNNFETLRLNFDDNGVNRYFDCPTIKEIAYALSVYGSDTDDFIGQKVELQLVSKTNDLGIAKTYIQFVGQQS
jgi:hypothetical protein